MANGRHRKAAESNKTIHKIALGSAVGLGAVVVPATFASSATAADMAKWECIAKYESSGDWSIPYGDADSTGGLQIQDRTWADFGGTAIAPHAYQATKAQQIAIAEKILASQGPNAWAVAGSCAGVGSWDGTTSIPAPDPAPTPDPKPSPAPSGDTGTYTVKAGDYLSKIAKEHGISDWHTLYNLNKDVIGSNPNLIQVGMILKLSDNPYAHGLPTPNHSSPSAVPLQQQLKRTGYMAKSVTENPNYGPQTQAAVGRFFAAHPEYSSRGVANDVAIGPKGWAFLRGAADSVGGTGGTSVPPVTPTPTGSDYVGPLATMHVIQSFHNPSSSYGLGYHTGVDLEAASGTPVRAVTNGTVVGVNAAGSAYGNHIVVKYGSGVYALYAHLSSVQVSVGQSVSKGQTIGLSGSTGNSSGPHLHFELRNDPTQYADGVFSDPVAWLESHGVTIN